MVLNRMVEHNKLIFTEYPPRTLIYKVSVLQRYGTLHWTAMMSRYDEKEVKR